MDILKWSDKYSVDCRLKYNSLATQENYISQVKYFLFYFKNELEPKSIPNDKIKEWLLEAKTINSRKHRLCAINSFYSLTVKMPNKISKIPYPKSEKKLPIVLSIEEIQRMFTACENYLVYLYCLFSMKILKEIPRLTLPNSNFCYNWISLCLVVGIFYYGNI